MRDRRRLRLRLRRRGPGVAVGVVRALLLKKLKLYDFICVPIGTDRLALYTGLLQQVCVSNYAYTGAKAAIFCYVLPRRAKKVSRPRLDRRTLPAGPREPGRERRVPYPLT